MLLYLAQSEKQAIGWALHINSPPISLTPPSGLHPVCKTNCLAVKLGDCCLFYECSSGSQLAVCATSWGSVERKDANMHVGGVRAGRVGRGREKTAGRRNLLQK